VLTNNELIAIKN